MIANTTVHGLVQTRHDTAQGQAEGQPITRAWQNAGLILVRNGIQETFIKICNILAFTIPQMKKIDQILK